jgi:hypothetical protein
MKLPSGLNSQDKYDASPGKWPSMGTGSGSTDDGIWAFILLMPIICVFCVFWLLGLILGRVFRGFRWIVRGGLGWIGELPVIRAHAEGLTTGVVVVVGGIDLVGSAGIM